MPLVINCPILISSNLGGGGGALLKVIIGCEKGEVVCWCVRQSGAGMYTAGV